MQQPTLLTDHRTYRQENSSNVPFFKLVLPRESLHVSVLDDKLDSLVEGGSDCRRLLCQ